MMFAVKRHAWLCCESSIVQLFQRLRLLDCLNAYQIEGAQTSFAFFALPMWFSLLQDKTFEQPGGRKLTVRYFDLSGGDKVTEYNRACKEQKAKQEREEWQLFRQNLKDKLRESQRKFKEPLPQVPSCWLGQALFLCLSRCWWATLPMLGKSMLCQF